jgi:hypothetical protein
MKKGKWFSERGGNQPRERLWVSAVSVSRVTGERSLYEWIRPFYRKPKNQDLLGNFI